MAASRPFRSCASTPKRRICGDELDDDRASKPRLEGRGEVVLAADREDGVRERVELVGQRGREDDDLRPSRHAGDFLDGADRHFVSPEVDGEAGQAFAAEAVAVALHDRHDVRVGAPRRAEMGEPGGAVDVEGDGHGEGRGYGARPAARRS